MKKRIDYKKANYLRLMNNAAVSLLYGKYYNNMELMVCDVASFVTMVKGLCDPKS